MSVEQDVAHWTGYGDTCISDFEYNKVTVGNIIQGWKLIASCR